MLTKEQKKIGLAYYRKNKDRKTKEGLSVVGYSIQCGMPSLIIERKHGWEASALDKIDVLVKHKRRIVEENAKLWLVSEDDKEYFNDLK